ncbi:Imm49 family immunity protein [Rhodoferax sp.]|uniref:Imm49 family immunity protein n=1 Tax=Rhodoferax sp. TaxID=50421 RepID=UPI002ACDC441|nr:Imm49 family immunity protein [Rhodoferax sp.]MDZ7919575.1 Imm49 family immunity protein [Rhodoferax sp.]
MSAELREAWLLRIAAPENYDSKSHALAYVENRSHGINRPGTLTTIAQTPIHRGLKSYFIDGSLAGLKQNFYVTTKLLEASQHKGWDAFAAYQPFLYGLLSDSPEIYEWLAHAELKNRDYVKGPHFLFHQFQLVLRQDDTALRETIAIVAKKGSNRDKALAAAGEDFFSLLLKRDKESLQALIEGYAKIKSAQELEGQFLAGFAVIHAKLCWMRGIEVEIKNPLVPMPLLPVQPLDTYDVEYDFLRPGWVPPPLSLLDKVRRWFK